ncbi:MAG: hypothetical protein RJB66_2600 [Pseudomonadota bacterium]
MKAYTVSGIIGLVSGILVALFLITLQWITIERQEHPYFILGLPLVGLATPWLYRSFGFGAEKGIKLVLEEIHKPQQIAPFAMAPLIYLTTLLSHLVGASVGREGTALQMSAATADRIAKYFHIKIKERRWVLMAALSAGFGAALGAPVAGAIFALEVIVVGHIEKTVVLECFIASFVAWATSVAMKSPHFEPQLVSFPEINLSLLMSLIVFSFVIGLISRAHVRIMHFAEHLLKTISPSWRAFLGGSILLALYLVFPLERYQGLGLETIRTTFIAAPTWDTPIIKFFLTIIALATGFKGGEFIPLVFIGATTGSVIAQFLDQPIFLFAAIGFVSLFASAAKTPWTCAVLAIEYFGWNITPFVILVTLVATRVAGDQGIYPGQKLFKQG